MMNSGLHIKYLLFLSDFHENLIFSTAFRKYSLIKVHENSSIGSQTVPCFSQFREGA